MGNYYKFINIFLNNKYFFFSLNKSKYNKQKTCYSIRIEDKNNEERVERSLYNKFDYWKSGLNLLTTNSLRHCKYLRFEVNDRSLYLCLCPGTDEDSFSTVRIFPQTEPWITSQLMENMNILIAFIM